MTCPDNSSRDYKDIGDLGTYYFEDSYVISIRESVSELSFAMELVLTENHPEYHPPLTGEQYCYRDGSLVFPSVTTAKLERSLSAGFRDATGTMDLGNIDSFECVAEEYRLEGDWGSLVVVSQPPYVVLSV